MRERVWAYPGLAVVAVILLVVGEVGDFVRFLTVLILVALGAAWIEVTRRQTAHEFPDASGAAVLGEARTRLSSWWDAARDRAAQPRQTAAPAGGSDLTSTLATLADLHARGELTDDEYSAAKARVLGGE